ncbi:MAG TPA: SPOR domain-containing protein, partial [Alphaproteobacteria bacterium]|nr:SPOR domain-containing protein [Alphaproteobacteria bacterium]
AGDYGIQIASVRDESGARSAWKNLVAAHPDLLGGLTLNIEKADLGEKGVFYRLQAGSLASLDDARSLCAKLKAQNVGCLPVRR